MQLDYDQHQETLNYYFIDFKLEVMMKELVIFYIIILLQKLFV
jgi:hypothetical protein